MIRARIRVDGRLEGDLQALLGAPMAACSGLWRARWRVPRPVLGKMQGDPACRVGDPSGQGEEPPPEGLGGHDLLTQADAGRPAGQVVRHHLYRQPSAVGGEAPRGEMVQPDAVLEVAYRILDLGVAAVVASSSRVSPSRSVMKP